MGWNSPSGKKFGLIVGAAIFAIVTAVFAVNCRNEFIRYDDYDYIVLNRNLESGLTPRSVKWAFCAAGYASNWHPLAWMSHAADISLAKALGLEWRGEKNDVGILTATKGAFPALVHAENVLWHAANAVLLWWLMMVMGRRFHRNRPTGDAVIAAGCTLLWALHPLRVEVVAWASERKELLSVFFMLLTLILYVRGGFGTQGACATRNKRAFFDVAYDGLRPTPQSENAQLSSKTFSGLALLSFVLALLAKPVAVSLPAVLCAYELVFEGSSFRRAFRRTWPFMAASAAVCWLTMASQTQGLAGGRDWSWMMRIVCAVEAPAVYLKQTFWPVGLCIDYVVPGRESWPYFAAGLVILAAMAAVCVWWLRRPNRWNGWGVFAIAWAYVGLLPMIGIVKVGYEPHNDRYTYWIACGASVVLFLVLGHLRPKWEHERGSLAKFAGAVLLALGVCAVHQSTLWKSTSVLFLQAVNETRCAFFAHGLADDLVANERKAGRDKAEKILRELVSDNPTAAAHAAFAFHLAAYCDGADTFSLGGEKVSPFIEARIAAEQALVGGDLTGLAYAALGFADYRESKFVSAYENMKKAMDLGFKSAIIPVNLEEWKAKAEEEDKVKGEGRKEKGNELE